MNKQKTINNNQIETVVQEEIDNDKESGDDEEIDDDKESGNDEESNGEKDFGLTLVSLFNGAVDIQNKMLK